MSVTLDKVQGANSWLTIGLREGKNREIRRAMEHIGLTVNRLIRISYGPFQLGDLPEGAVEEVKGKVLADQLGLARETVRRGPAVATPDAGPAARRPGPSRPARPGPAKPGPEKPRPDGPKRPRPTGGKPDAPRRRPQG
jgi:23S rRNA pseudouridine2605 synthase